MQNLLHKKIFSDIIYKLIKGLWRNWQTRTFKGRVRKYMGSSPISPTNSKT